MYGVKFNILYHCSKLQISIIKRKIFGISFALLQVKVCDRSIKPENIDYIMSMKSSFYIHFERVNNYFVLFY